MNRVSQDFTSISNSQMENILLQKFSNADVTNLIGLNTTLRQNLKSDEGKNPSAFTPLLGKRKYPDPCVI